MYFRLQVRAITPKISDRRLGEEEEEEEEEEVVGGGEGGREEGRGGCRTVHHPNINKCHRELGFWGSPPRLAFACNPERR